MKKNITELLNEKKAYREMKNGMNAGNRQLKKEYDEGGGENWEYYQDNLAKGKIKNEVVDHVEPTTEERKEANHSRYMKYLDELESNRKVAAENKAKAHDALARGYISGNNNFRDSKNELAGLNLLFKNIKNMIVSVKEREK